MRWLGRVALLTIVMLVGGGAVCADAYPGRVVVALSGDSIVEGEGVMSPWGMAAALRSRLRSLGYAPGGMGYVPAHGATVWGSTDGTVLAPPWTYAGRWLFGGVSPFFASNTVDYVQPATYGPDGHYSQTTSAGSSAAGRLDGQRFGAVFVRGPEDGSFDFAVDGAARTVRAQRPGAETSGVAWLTAPSGGNGSHRVVLRAVGDGALRFTGVVARRTVGARRQIEVSQLGKSCGCADEDLHPAQRAALGELHADITIVLFGINEQNKLLTSPSAAIEQRFVSALRTRAAIARRSGSCAIVPPAPNARSAQVQQRVAELERKAARRSHCRYAPVFGHLWGADSAQRGLTVDGLHPTAAGYRRMAAALARLITQMAPAPGRVRAATASSGTAKLLP